MNSERTLERHTHPENTVLLENGKTIANFMGDTHIEDSKIAMEAMSHPIIREFACKIAKVFDDNRSSNMWFYMQKAFGDGDYEETQDIINQVLAATGQEVTRHPAY